MSETLKAIIVDNLTGKIIERDFNDEETKIHEKMTSDYSQNQKDIKAKAKARESALAKLAALGLSEEEIASL
jgi:DNA-binding NarL/FixJ family response regulator